MLPDVAWHDRLVSEGDQTPADLLLTVDGANLWRAKDEGLLLPVQSATIESTRRSAAILLRL